MVLGDEEDWAKEALEEYAGLADDVAQEEPDFQHMKPKDLRGEASRMYARIRQLEGDPAATERAAKRRLLDQLTPNTKSRAAAQLGLDGED